MRFVRGWAALAATTVLLVGCGKAEDDGPRADASTEPTFGPCGMDAVGTGQKADLDGGGKADLVSIMFGHSEECPGSLSAGLNGGIQFGPFDLDADLELAAMIRIPGRTGQVALFTARHPRGGVEAHLYGYADGDFAELRIDGGPVVPFTATDTTSTPLAARCTEGGFEIVRARAHEPVGVAAAWDVFATAYTVDGNEVAGAAEREIEDNVLPAVFETKYADLLAYEVFTNCKS